MRRYLALGLALVAVGSCSPTGNDGTGPTIAVATVTVAPALDTVYISALSQLTATTKDADGNTLTGRTVAWSKTGTGATVSPTGLVTGTATGDVTVTATSEGVPGNASIFVRPVPVVSVVLTPATDTIYLGATASFSATPRDSIGGALTGRVTNWSALDAAASVNNVGLVTSLSLGTARIVAYVDGKGDTSVVTVLPVPVSSVVITPSADTLYPTNTLQLTAVTRDSANGVLVGRVVTWSSLDAAASVSVAGLVTANSIGSARVVATSEGKADTALITVAAVPVASIVVTPAADTLYPTNTVQLTAVTRDSANSILAGRVVTWSSLDAATSVNNVGLITALSLGTARIVATSEGKADTSDITVLAVPVASVVLTPAGDTLPIGEGKQFVAATRDSVGGTLAGRVVSWSSTAPLIASVSASGLVTALDTGTTSVIATSEGKSDTAIVRVTLRPVGSVVVTPASDTLQVGDSAQFAATVLDTAGAPLAGRPVTWSSLDTTASVSAGGQVHALVIGTARIVATREGKADTALITVAPVPVSVVAVSPDSALRYPGQSIPFTAVTLSAAGDTLTGRALVWSSSDSAKATVSGAGLVTAIGVGNVMITATSEGHQGSGILHITLVPVATVTVTPDSARVEVDATKSLAAVARDSAGGILVGRPFSWTSLSPGTASVNGAGTVTALVLGGPVGIVAATGGRADTAWVTVTPKPVTNVMGIALEANGTTAIVSGNGKISRVDLQTRAVLADLVTGLTVPVGIAIEAGGSTALVAELGAGRVIRVDLTNGAVIPIATGLANPRGIAIESGGMTALVTEQGRLSRVTLATGAVNAISPSLSQGGGIFIEAGGATALVPAGSLYRVDLTSGLTSVIGNNVTMGTTAVQASIAGEAGGGTVLISTDEGCLIRVTLSSGVGSRLSCQYQSSGPFAVDGSGSVAYLGDPARLLKTYLAPTVQTVAIGLDGAVDIDVEAGDTTAIVALMGAFAGPPSVVRLSLATGVSSFIATPPRFGIYGLRVDAAGVNAYVVGDDNYIDRVVLASGAVSEVTNLLTGVSVHQLAIEAGDSTALITAVGNLYRVSLGTGAVTSVSGCCALASDPVVEPDGHSVLTGGVSGQYLARSDLLTGLTVTLFNNLRLDGSARAECSAIALEGDGHHLLMAQPGTFGQPNFQGRLIRIDLLTRAVTVIASGLQGLGNSYCGTNGIALETGGGSLLVTSDDGVIRRITLPLAN